MINNVLLVTATTLFVSAHASGHFMREPIKRPICAPSESCLTTGFGFRFGVCDCPGENPTCPENNPHSMVQHNEFNYHFCKPRHLALCKKGEIATSVIGIKMQMHCLCPEGDEFLAQPVDAFSNVINYVCGQNSTNAPTAKELNSQWSSMIMTNYQHWKDQQTELKTCELGESCEVNLLGTPQKQCSCPGGTACVGDEQGGVPAPAYCV